MLCVFKRTVSIDGSIEHPKHMLKLMDKKIFTILCSRFLLLRTYDLNTIFLFISGAVANSAGFSLLAVLGIIYIIVSY